MCYKGYGGYGDYPGHVGGPYPTHGILAPGGSGKRRINQAIGKVSVGLSDVLSEHRELLGRHSVEIQGLCEASAILVKELKVRG